MKKQKLDQDRFLAVKNFYKPVAKRVGNLFFVILDLSLIEPTYQWSLDSYIVIFKRGIEKGVLEGTPGKEFKCNNIINKFQILLY